MTNYVKAPADVLNVNCTICCPNGHILGAFEAGNTLRVKHKGRLLTFRSGYAVIEVVCERCGKTVEMKLQEPNLYVRERRNEH